MTEISPRTQGTAIGADLLGKLKSGIAESRANTVIAGGKPLLRLLRDASWVFGQKDDPVEEGSLWAINPLSIAHGWVAWTNHQNGQKNSIVGEVMTAVHSPKPERPAPVDGWAFTEQRMFELRCMNGDDEGTEVTYKISSVGGMRAVDDLLATLQGQLNSNPLYPCPVVELLSDSYQHTTYGKIYVPILQVEDWATMDGLLLSEETPAVAAAPPPPPPPPPAPVAAAPVPKPTRKSAAAAPAPAAPVEPEPTARRRPIRRG
jgi:hypothetical protein